MCIGICFKLFWFVVLSSSDIMLVGNDKIQNCQDKVVVPVVDMWKLLLQVREWKPLMFFQNIPDKPTLMPSGSMLFYIGGGGVSAIEYSTHSECHPKPSYCLLSPQKSMG